MTALWRGELSPRRAAVLAVHLPPGAMVWRELGIDAAWTGTEHRLADLFDALQVANWQRGGGTHSNRPAPLPRPSDIRERGEQVDRMTERARRFRARHTPAAQQDSST